LNQSLHDYWMAALKAIVTLMVNKRIVEAKCSLCHETIIAHADGLRNKNQDCGMPSDNTLAVSTISQSSNKAFTRP
jgi:hypothetical protein